MESHILLLPISICQYPEDKNLLPVSVARKNPTFVGLLSVAP